LYRGVGIAKTPQQRRVVFESHCERRKRYVFSFVLNVASDMFSREAGGRLFHTAGLLYAKLRCPVDVWTRGSRMQRVDADRSRRRPQTSSMGTQSSRRYVGATPLTHFHAITADLKVTRCCTGSQWWSIGESRSRRRAPDTRRAVAFWTAWSRLICNTQHGKKKHRFSLARHEWCIKLRQQWWWWLLLLLLTKYWLKWRLIKLLQGHFT